ncbi:MAG TPA: dihydrofolate reductase family protein, partial [Candidatus Polarisedimenticolia bacterium]|nr:dihydrofolate reductase family protein [Candidatus Polarisedimenticolia bacterium]
MPQEPPAALQSRIANRKSQIILPSSFFIPLPLCSPHMSDAQFMQLALRLARKGCGQTSPNPMVGAVLVKGRKIIGQGWHRRAGLPHAEIEALQDARRKGHNPKGATLYVTLEPCSTHGRTPPCTQAITAAKINRVVIGAIDPNPRHAGQALKILKRANIATSTFDKASARPFPVRRSLGKGGARAASPGLPASRRQAAKLAHDCAQLNEPFNHWIVHRTPFVTVKSSMTLDGKIATPSGESKWITGHEARDFAMNLRAGFDAILTGVNTILLDNPRLTARKKTPNGKWKLVKPLRRIILDSQARTPLTASVVTDEFASLTTIVVTPAAPKTRVAALAKR